VKVLGLIGKSLKHSFSKSFFEEKFRKLRIADEYQFINYEINKISQIFTLIEENTGLLGFNVTIPYKSEILPYLTRIEPEARKIGAVNTVRIDRSGNIPTLSGYNTDTYGFETMLLNHPLKDVNRALVLGTGGASRAVIYILNKFNIDVKRVSRNSDRFISYSQITPALLKDHQLIINTTPLGMYPFVDELPELPYFAATPDHLFIDLVYNPPLTQFLETAKSYGASICNGQMMLEYQAEKSWKIYMDE
jgi:shikimate dehydrogenase